MLILLRRRVAELDDGTVVHLSTRDPVAPIDLPVWCDMTGHDYLGVVAADPPTYAVRVTSTPTPTDDRRPWHRIEPERDPGA
ncbi:hypothetical protein CCO02nite_07510 [Cellulomonas composti]|uniref:Uncharacterized protein n=1 Tax=Cellulomonas composti TaxID=266130 RepID=A0A511J8P6_9CELL|nr:hypothetical protein CCO02nite_07510 [Cellulomonas composti]